MWLRSDQRFLKGSGIHDFPEVSLKKYVSFSDLPSISGLLEHVLMAGAWAAILDHEVQAKVGREA